MRVFRLAALMIMLTLGLSSNAMADVFVSVHIAPPVLPVYAQPIIPGPGFIWQPGYWAYGPEGYYWVPGVWVQPPRVGLLWTPGYWGWRDGFYAWNAGYWGPHVGFYGGVAYGFGYVGVGYVGGFWRDGVFNYNRSVNNVTIVQNTYVKNVVNNTNVTTVSYNGGVGGMTARPTAEEEAAAHEQHIAATPEQMRHEHAASVNHAQLASVNHGRPTVAASARAAEFRGRGVTSARAAMTTPVSGAPTDHQRRPEAQAEHPHGPREQRRHPPTKEEREKERPEAERGPA